MTNAGQPPTTEERLSRLETLFANIGETVLAQNDAIAAMSVNVNGQSNTIDVLVANIQQLTENVNAVTNRVDILAIQAERDRQVFQAEIRRIWEYLLGQSGNGSNPPRG